MIMIVLQLVLKQQTESVEVDQDIVFAFLETYIELHLEDSVSKGWRLNPHVKPLRVSNVFASVLL